MSGLLYLDNNETTAFLEIDGVEIERLNVKRDNNGLKLYESELKHRFREIYPHSSVYRTSPEKQLVVFVVLVVIIFLGILFVIYLKHLQSLGYLLSLIIGLMLSLIVAYWLIAQNFCKITSLKKIIV